MFDMDSRIYLWLRTIVPELGSANVWRAIFSEIPRLIRFARGAQHELRHPHHHHHRYVYRSDEIIVDSPVRHFVNAQYLWGL